MFEYMDYIYEVYKEQNFSRAAEKLFISQSSLSLTIKHAEEKIGSPIFNRKTKPVSLTEFGKMYIDACEQVRSLRAELGNYIYETNHLHRGTLSIGAGNFFATYLLAPFIAEFKRDYPNITINLIEGRSVDMEAQLEKGNLDMIVTNATYTSPIIEKKKLFSEQLLLVVPEEYIDDPHIIGASLSKEDLLSGHYANSVKVDFSVLSGMPFVGLRQGNDTRTRADQIMREGNISPDYMMELDQSSTAFIIASDNSGCALIADTIVRTLWQDQDIYVFPVSSEHAYRDVSVYTNSTRYQTVIQEDFLDSFHAFVRDLYPEADL